MYTKFKQSFLGKGICEAIDGLLEIIFPSESVCANCGRIEVYDYGLCKECYFEVLNKSIFSKVQRNYPIKVEFDEVYSVCRYEGLPKEMIRRLKYKEKVELANVFAKFMVDVINNFNIDFDIIVPVPSSKKRIRIRGYNQASLIARNISNLTGKKVLECVEKIRDTKSQTLFKDQNRWYNVKGVFKCSTDLSGKNILLVDDVFTSGATAHFNSVALKKSNAKKIIVLTFAT
ncbi:DNA utilization protein GntX [Caloramator mitchellensis]|uniref:DNA utilization protein GntX n=1 Tax=Caloramator mitchellensis TaxID=908809 RepID=A0A0R3K2S0_CALMK|nr:ComF family protein [Caloramator mitchellensis]KRQ87716.1 DNA utilization protein GntX [Caloramator mitchellensis]